jgi:P27 family predicted phage terminase small subunit
MSRRLPSAVKELRGTDRRDRRNLYEPKPKTATPRPHGGLSERAKRERRVLVRLLMPMRVLTISDGAALDLLSEAMAEYHEARAVLARDGQSYECVTAAGAKMRRVRPEQAVAADAMRRAVHLIEQFGLTPASRAKVEQLPPSLPTLSTSSRGAGRYPPDKSPARFFHEHA